MKKQPMARPNPARQGGAAAGPGRPGRQRVPAKGSNRRAEAHAREQRRKRLQVLFAAATALIVLAVIAVVYSQTSSGSGTPAAVTPGIATPEALAPAQDLLGVGSTAPDFNLATADGHRYRLSSLRGSPVMIEYFAIWCPVCHAEAPTVNQIVAHYGPKGLKALAIVANPYGPDYETKGDMRPATKADLAWYRQTYRLAMPILIDPSFANVNAMGASHYPTIYVIDAKGIVRFAQTGGLPYASLAAAIGAAGLHG